MKKLAFAALAAAVLCGCSDSGADKVKMITEAVSMIQAARTMSFH